jgi:sphinganine C4-monooxygenase
MDSWQYFWHRSFHTWHFLYRHIHSVHHRLYVPYAFGALYNHPIEGLILDTLGAVVSHSLTRMTIRQAILLFTFSTFKTVDDHCGYRIWWDPCQLFFANNSDYHDIHHQAYGIKANFSQPFL